MTDEEINLLEIGKRITERRKKLGMTQEMLAEKGDLTPQFVSYAESGKRLLALLATWTSSLLPSILLHITINVSSYFTGMLPFALPHTGCILATGITSAAGFIALYLLLRRSGKSHKVS